MSLKKGGLCLWIKVAIKALCYNFTHQHNKGYAMPITQENLFSYMQAWLRECDMKILGYHNDTKAQKTKKCFCDSLHLLEFLDTFSYDLVYSSKEFFLAVAKKSQKRFRRE